MRLLAFRLTLGFLIILAPEFLFAQACPEFQRQQSRKSINRYKNHTQELKKHAKKKRIASTAKAGSERGPGSSRNRRRRG